MALDARPEFVWTNLASASDYVVKVFGRRGEPLWTHTTTAAKIAYGGERPLSEGDYRWEVTARIEQRVTADQSLYDAAPFTVGAERSSAIRLALDQARQVGAESGACNIAYIGALLEHRLYPQAEIELRQALARSPRDQSLWSLLMESYQLMRRWPDREKARAISARPDPAGGLQQLPGLPR
jgi:hypothetical protein